jgi:CRISPR/Cas system CSM-associated protein Csm2 small subunit
MSCNNSDVSNENLLEKEYKYLFNEKELIINGKPFSAFKVINIKEYMEGIDAAYLTKEVSLKNIDSKGINFFYDNYDNYSEKQPDDAWIGAAIDFSKLRVKVTYQSHDLTKETTLTSFLKWYPKLSRYAEIAQSNDEIYIPFAACETYRDDHWEFIFKKGYLSDLYVWFPD